MLPFQGKQCNSILFCEDVSTLLEPFICNQNPPCRATIIDSRLQSEHIGKRNSPLITFALAKKLEFNNACPNPNAYVNLMPLPRPPNFGYIVFNRNELIE